MLADAWSELPLRERSVSAVLSVFAPRKAEETARVLAPAGIAVVVTPEPAHLLEVRRKLPMLTVDPGKAQRSAQAFAGLLEPVTQQLVAFDMRLRPDEISALVRMGPSARHVARSELDSRTAELPPSMTVRAAVTVSTFRRPEP